MDEGGVEREYRKRRKQPRTQLLLLGLLLVNAFVQTNRVSADGGSGRDWWGPPVFALVMVLAIVRIALEQFRAHTRVTAAGITAQGPVRARTWAWSEVYDIRVEQAPRGSGRAAPRWLTYLYDFQGRRFLLWHLNDWQLDDPYAEVAELCLAAAPLRSLTWERRPDVEELILRGAARRKAWTWGAYGAIAVFCLMFVLDVALIAVGRPDHPFVLFVCVPLASGAALALVLDRYWGTRPPSSPARQP
ncbi:MAG: PH domain-containing protein [Streptomyces sp.]|uniref:PH domain-containing protein n=1 Tax=Streptomyces sp. TaxID=1931 RepID=UPI0025E71A06|nr:PH domain-containing protein [Streptomyces sp.]MBW8798624.1 PH domain-containing protein [Streptomyces sp.]